MSVNCLGSWLEAPCLQILTFCRFFFPLADVFVSKETPASVQLCRAEQHSPSVFPLLHQLDRTPDTKPEKCAKSLQSSSPRCLCKIKMGQYSIPVQLIRLHMTLALQSLISLLVRRQEEVQSSFYDSSFLFPVWETMSVLFANHRRWVLSALGRCFFLKMLSVSEG